MRRAGRALLYLAALAVAVGVILSTGRLVGRVTGNTNKINNVEVKAELAQQRADLATRVAVGNCEAVVATQHALAELLRRARAAGRKTGHSTPDAEAFYRDEIGRLTKPHDCRREVKEKLKRMRDRLRDGGNAAAAPVVPTNWRPLTSAAPSRARAPAGGRTRTRRRRSSGSPPPRAIAMPPATSSPAPAAAPPPGPEGPGPPPDRRRPICDAAAERGLELPIC